MAKGKAISNGLLVLPLEEGNIYVYHLVYKLTISKNNPPACWVYFIDAHTGEILLKYNNIRYASISGRVTGLMLPECRTDSPQIVDFKDEYVKIADPAILDTTRIDGSYNLSINPGDYSLTSSLEGPWVKVMNDVNSGINNASYTGSVTSPSTGNDINWTTENATQAEMNVFYHVNKMHDYVKNTLGYNIYWQIGAEVNANYSVASFNSGIWNLTFGGSRGIFALFSDVIYHEYTHAVTEMVYDKGGADLPYYGESGAIDEGLADYFACTINENSRVDGTNRDLNNTLKISNDWKSDIHDNGMIIGGAFWLSAEFPRLCRSVVGSG